MLLNNLPIILTFLNQLVNTKHDRMAEAKGILSQIDFKFVFTLCMFCDTGILFQFKAVSDFMQSVSAEIGEILNLLLRPY